MSKSSWDVFNSIKIDLTQEGDGHKFNLDHYDTMCSDVTNEFCKMAR